MVVLVLCLDLPLVDGAFVAAVDLDDTCGNTSRKKVINDWNANEVGYRFGVLNILLAIVFSTYIANT